MSWLIDSNVLSETRKRKANPQVMAWLADHHAKNHFISVVSLGELRAGAEIKKINDLPAGLAIERWLSTLKVRYERRFLPVTEEIVETWGRLSPAKPLPEMDGLIAATALVHGLIVVTRNVRDFERAGVEFLNPWEY